MTNPVSMAIYYIAIEYSVTTTDDETHFLKHCMQADIDLKGLNLEH